MLRRLTLVACALGAFVLPAHAVDTKIVPHVDDDALRYYASLGQKDRVAAEAKRLSALDPDWRMPDDLYATRPGRSDEAPLWALYRDGRFDEIDRAIAARRAVEPSWNPSPDLLAKIATRQLRTKIIALAKVGQWRDIVQNAKATGISWAADDAEALWIFAEAYARQNDCAEAFTIYHSILAGRTNAGERRATIEYAIARLPMAMTEKLLTMERVDETGQREFGTIGIDITRARISAFLHDEPANKVSDIDLQRFEDKVRSAADPNEFGLVAWYAFKQHDDKVALEWFKLAISHGGDAMIAHGLAHTLRRLDRRREAEEVAYAWREPLVNNTILFIDLLETDLTKANPPSIEPDRLARYAVVTMATESGEGAQALGWYAYNTCRYSVALQWFEHATAWLPKEATVYGYALALQRMHRMKDFRDVVNRYDGLFPKVVALAFDDGIRTPPPSCDTTSGISEGEGVAKGTDGVDWTGRSMAETLRPQLASRSPFHPTIPSPDAAGGDGNAPLRKRTEFPVSVSPENPLRFSAGKAARAGDQREYGVWPLVARRVPGVGVMPYERYGFALSPGWDGARDASVPTAMERNAADGTLWALEQSSSIGVYHTPQPVDALARLPMANVGADTMSRPGGRS